jgi:hypothetical protein
MGTRADDRGRSTGKRPLNAEAALSEIIRGSGSGGGQRHHRCWIAVKVATRLRANCGDDKFTEKMI